MKDKKWMIREVAAYVFLLVALVYFVQSRNNIEERPAIVSPVEGKVYDLYNEVVEASSEYSIVLALSPDCPFCMMSMEFYREMAEEGGQFFSRNGLHAIVSSDALIDAENELLQREGVAVHDVSSVDFEKLDISGVPMVIVVDQSGEVVRHWRGLLTEEKEQEVLSFIDELSSRTTG